MGVFSVLSGKAFPLTYAIKCNVSYAIAVHFSTWSTRIYTLVMYYIYIYILIYRHTKFAEIIFCI